MLAPSQRTPGGRRRYAVSSLHPRKRSSSRFEELPIMAYARFSIHDQKEDLARQEKMLELVYSPLWMVF